jgi:hypothetical protein
MKKWFKVLEVNHIIEEMTGHVNCDYSSYTESCVVEDLETGEVISINEQTTNEREAQMIKKVDAFDLIVGDEFRI